MQSGLTRASLASNGPSAALGPDLKAAAGRPCATPRRGAYVLLCILAYHFQWYMRQALVRLLFDDHDLSSADAVGLRLGG